MKAAEIFKQYIWLTDMSGGLPMTRATFNRHRVAIEEIFDLCIECRCKGGYVYYIENKEVLENNHLQHWMLDSLSISNLLMESNSLKDRILLENIPSGKEHLQPIITAMKQGHKLAMTYQKFGQPSGYTITIDPYAIKVFKQRWYLLGNDYKRNRPTIYALDRILSIEELNEPFDYPLDFDTRNYFNDLFGVLKTNDSPQQIVIRAYPPLINYLRTLPLHHSQKELGSTAQYADFSFYLCPTFDFRQELLSQGDEVEVLQPESFRKEMKEMLERMISRYKA